MSGDSNITTEQLYAKFLEVDAVVTDSRHVLNIAKQGKRIMFFCLKGENFDANNFIDSVLRDGATYVISDSKDRESTSSVLKTNDVLCAMQTLASHHRSQMRATFIALTGSNGKTTTKELLNSVLSKKYNVLATVGNLNNHIGVPLTILSVKPFHDIAIIEQGANHQGEIKELCMISKPNYGLITNVGRAHLDGFGGVDGIVKGKGELFDFLEENSGTAFYNSDLEHLSGMIASRVDLKSIAYNDSLIKRNDLSTISGISFDYGDKLVQTHLSGEYNILNILSVIAIGHYFEVTMSDIANAISDYEPHNMRSQVVKTSRNRVIIDAYNANPSSMQCAIDNFNRFAEKKRCYLLGQMNELGAYSSHEHESLVSEIGELLKKRGNIDIAIFIGVEYKGLIRGDNMLWYETALEAANYLEKKNLSGYDLLLKGSRGVGLEKLLVFL